MTLKAVLSLAVMSLPLAVQAAPADRSADYEQVRKIAARDPKVRAAYEAADRKLQQRILEIDPTLKGYEPGKTPVAKKTTAAPAEKAQPARKAAPAPKRSGTHVVAKGETLGGIAARYDVSVAALKGANGIKDERKLAIGQKLVIPGGKQQPATARTTAKPASKKSDSFWNQLGF
jgi:LysM repeat protein